VPLAEAVEAAAAAGVDWLQIRERDLEGGALLALADALAAAARRGNPAVRVLMNRRVDVALCAGLDGVHLGFDGMPPEAARALLPKGALLGTAAHSPEEVAASPRGLVSYVHLAPIFPPRSKPSTRPPLGLGALAEAAGAGPLLIAQGGIDASNAAACLGAGAAGVAVTGAILTGEDPGAAAAALRSALDGARPGP
jgi:thiamine-phosphate pyrophosphorylase